MSTSYFPDGIAKPGQRGGPCRAVCLHDSCEADRTIAASACSICSGAIGYRESYVVETEDVGDGFDRETYTHAFCAAKAAEQHPTPPQP